MSDGFNKNLIIIYQKAEVEKKFNLSYQISRVFLNLKILFKFIHINELTWLSLSCTDQQQQQQMFCGIMMGYDSSDTAKLYKMDLVGIICVINGTHFYWNRLISDDNNNVFICICKFLSGVHFRFNDVCDPFKDILNIGSNQLYNDFKKFWTEIYDSRWFKKINK